MTDRYMRNATVVRSGNFGAVFAPLLAEGALKSGPSPPGRLEDVLLRALAVATELKHWELVERLVSELKARRSGRRP
jgi:hypothetical protein